MLWPGRARTRESEILVSENDGGVEVASTVTGSADPEQVFVEISAMLRLLLEDVGVEDAEIELGTRFHDDLELESIDLVALSGLLKEHYGEVVNFAEFIADLELEQIMAVTVGELVDFVVRSLDGAAAGQ
jgi:acyl carrier protein